MTNPQGVPQVDRVIFQRQAALQQEQLPGVSHDCLSALPLRTFVGSVTVREMMKVPSSHRVAAQGPYALFIRPACTSGLRAQTHAVVNSASTTL